MTDREGLGGLNFPQEEIISIGSELFENPPTLKDYVNGFMQEYYPVTSTDSSGPFEFYIPGDGKHYLILPQTRLYGKIQILKHDNTKIDATDNKIGIVNLCPSSLFKQIEIEINGKKISDATSSMYGYKAMIETQLSYGYTAKKSHLICCGYYNDTPNHHDRVLTDNKGWLERQKLIKASRVMDFETILYCDFFQIYRYLPNNLDIRVKLIRNSDAFSLHCNNATENYKIKIYDLSLTVRKIELHESLYKLNEKLFSQNKVAILPIVRTQLKTFVIPTGISSKILPNILTGQLPRTVIISLVSSKSFNGDKNKNPFNFQHFKMKNICLRVDGITTPSTPYFMDFDKKLYMRPYRALSDATGFSHTNAGNFISHFDFEYGNTFFAFDLTPDQCNGWHEHTRKSGTIDLEMIFEKDTTEAVNIIVYANFENRILIDKDKNLTTDYTV